MSDSVEDRVRTIIASVLKAPPDHVRPETQLSLADLGWKGFLEITCEIEYRFGISLPVEVPNCWTTVADFVVATENALVARARSAA